MHFLLTLILSSSPVTGYDRLAFGAGVVEARLAYPGLKDAGEMSHGRHIYAVQMDVVGISARVGLIFDRGEFAMAWIEFVEPDAKTARADFAKVQIGLKAKYGKPEVMTPLDQVWKRPPGEIDHFLDLQKGHVEHVLGYFDPKRIPDLTGRVDTRGL